MNLCVFQEFLCRRTCLTSKSFWIWTSWALWNQNPILNLSFEPITSITYKPRCDGLSPLDNAYCTSVLLHSDHFQDLFELCSFLNKCVISVPRFLFFSKTYCRFSIDLQPEKKTIWISASVQLVLLSFTDI